MRILVAAVMTMSVAQLLDLATFEVMVRQVGPDAEANPLVAALYGAHGLPVVAIAKVALVSLVAAVVAVLARAPAPAHLARFSIVAILALAIAAGVVGSATNTAAIGLL
jgi:hypothetical protein